MTPMKRNLANFNLTSAMESLYTTGQYFVRVQPERAQDPTTDYWGESTDPDGIQRNRLNEKTQYLENLKTELHFISCLTPGRLLDIGCGPGWLLSCVDSRWSKHGVEPSAQASTEASSHGIIYRGAFETVDYDDSFFDLVIAYHVIEHMKDPVAAVRKIRDLLKPGGIMIVGTPDFDSGCARRFGNNYRLLNDPTHISLFSNDSMHRCLRDSRFQILKVDYPFFSTMWFNRTNLLRCFDTSRISPPAYGNFMTFYCRKP